MKIRLLDYSSVPWERLDAFADRTVFQTREWLGFLAETQNAKPVVAELAEGGEVAGYFTGLTFHRFGVRILGSSFPGWTTPYIGFNLCPGASRRAALEALEELAFGELGCLHIEVSDRHFDVEDARGLGFATKFYESYLTDLRASEEDIFRSMSSACRRCIRKAEKSGVVVEEARDEGFAEEYFAQLTDVFEKQELVPMYTVARVRALIRNLFPTGRLLLLRARSPEGACIATGIYPGMNKVAEFWGNASFRATQILRPNEALHWRAMRYWKSRGVESFDWGGGGTYKEKYGPAPIAVPWFCKSKYPWLMALREGARNFYDARQRLLGRLRKRRRSPAASGSEDRD